MVVHRTQQLHVYFGDAQDRIYLDKNNEPQFSANTPLLSTEPFAKLSLLMPINELMFLHQVHEANGFVIKPPLADRPFVREGDYLLTNCSGIGIGVLTADCLPVVIYDQAHHAIGVVHAGWRSAVKKIMIRALEHMEKEFGTRRSQVQIFYGPSAKDCCYEVREDFLSNLHGIAWSDAVIKRQQQKTLFDLSGFNTHMLQDAGISPRSIVTKYHTCTVCNNQFFSYRRQGAAAGRQMMVASLQ